MTSSTFGGGVTAQPGVRLLRWMLRFFVASQPRGVSDKAARSQVCWLNTLTTPWETFSCPALLLSSLPTLFLPVTTQWCCRASGWRALRGGASLTGRRSFALTLAFKAHGLKMNSFFTFFSLRKSHHRSEHPFKKRSECSYAARMSQIKCWL